MKYLLDTDWVIDAFIGIPAALSVLRSMSGHGIGVSVVTYGELFEGSFSEPDPERMLALYRVHVQTFQFVPLTDPIMETFARIRHSLRRQGRLIPDIDLQIASTAVTLDLTLLTRNVRHFERISELRLYEQPISQG